MRSPEYSMKTPVSGRYSWLPLQEDKSKKFNQITGIFFETYTKRLIQKKHIVMKWKEYGPCVNLPRSGHLHKLSQYLCSYLFYI